MELSGPVPGAQEARPGLSPDVTRALAALVPQEALQRAFGRGARGGGSLSWRHVRVDEAQAADLLGGPVPSLSALRGPDVVEHLSVHRGLPTEPLRAQLEAGWLTLHLRLASLPAAQRWEHALLWPVVRQGASVLDVRAQQADTRPTTPWPQRVASSRDVGGDDFTVVTVAGTEVGVQVDTSGVVHLTWQLLRGGHVLRASLLTRREPGAAVELVATSGLLERG
ncbi:hypothetical protein [Kineococcus rubinsiae]|uniref:hypothetical protein n=1 Tax=Kineococcus rubinsiae TaxID=2609562 RepID=UPI00143075BA|nr:hypothetical protein [Kineococcus rubinsiae]NIZ91181.1 hypothetical protein [Kineococcus rubinsiae]